ncbi:hypothetical protein GOV10_05680, partial [Candidatus Woesearchaeota archaeon]|nr:hypothetical protein [Candidatus Woesearchaeota archaeon]
DNLTECSTQLANYKDRLTEEEEKATSAAQDIRRYDQLYETKVDELEDLEGDLANAQNVAQMRALTIASKDKEIDNLGQTINTKNQEISALNIKIDQLRDDIDILEDDLYACENP